MRARWLKPEFFTDKKMAALGLAAGFVFEALWCIADDGGVAQCDAILLKGQLLMRWEELTIPVIETALSALAEAGRVQHYALGDRDYYLIHSWPKNQPVHNPGQFRHPRPTQRVAGTEGEGLRQEGDIPAPPLPPSSPPIHLNTSTPQHLSNRSFEELWLIYPSRAGGNSKADALAAFNARLKQGATAEQMLSGTRRYAAFCGATDKLGTEYVKQARTFLGKGRHYLEPYDVPSANGSHANGSRPSVAEQGYANAKLAIQDL